MKIKMSRGGKDMSIITLVYKEYLEALLKGDRKKCLHIADNLVQEGIHPMVIYEELFKVSLYEVGKLWEINAISVSTEYLATIITESIMNIILPEFVHCKKSKGMAVVACIENEEHQVGGKMVADVFENHGWDTKYLGANTSTKELVEFCETFHPEVICLSLTIYFNLPFLQKELKEIREKLETPIFLGGQALYNIGDEVAAKYKNVRYLANLYELERYFKGDEIFE